MEGTDSAMRVATVVRMGRESDREIVGRAILRIAWFCASQSRALYGLFRESFLINGADDRIWFTSAKD